MKQTVSMSEIMQPAPRNEARQATKAVIDTGLNIAGEAAKETGKALLKVAELAMQDPLQPPEQNPLSFLIQKDKEEVAQRLPIVHAELQREIAEKWPVTNAYIEGGQQEQEPIEVNPEAWEMYVKARMKYDGRMPPSVNTKTGRINYLDYFENAYKPWLKDKEGERIRLQGLHESRQNRSEANDSYFKWYAEVAARGIEMKAKQNNTRPLQAPVRAEQPAAANPPPVSKQAA